MLLQWLLTFSALILLEIETFGKSSP